MKENSIRHKRRHRIRHVILRLIVHLERYANKPWYIPLITLLAAADLFVAIIPMDGVMITSVFLRPRRWIPMALSVTTGSSFGALLLAWLTRIYGEPLIQIVVRKSSESDTWQNVIELLANYGALALTLVAASPMPQQPAVILCALAHMPLSTILLAVWIGRGLKNVFLSWSATHAPRLLTKWRTAATEAQEIEAEEARSKTSV